MFTLRSAFSSLDAAERACRVLEGRGVPIEDMSLTFDENCPACALENVRARDEADDATPIGQGLGAMLGIGFGIAAVFWPLASTEATGTLSLFDWMIRLFIVSSWALSGAILGGMLAGMLREAWEAPGRREGPSPLHSHYILSVTSPFAMDPEIPRLIQARGGRLLETPATLRQM